MSEHHDFSPSCLERRYLCPASYRIEKGLPEHTSDIATEGTQIHDEIANAINSTWLDDFVDYDDIVLCALDYVRKITSNFDHEDIYTEKRLECSYLNNVLYYGTADVLIVCEDRVIIIDWKTGYNPTTEAENNWQGKAYALAAMREYSKDIAEVHFVNPRLKRHTQATFDNKNMLLAEIVKIIKTAEQENAPCIPCEKACQYCKANLCGTCPAIHKTLATVEKQLLTPSEQLQLMNADDLCELKRRCDLIAPLLARVTDEVKSRCELYGTCCKWELKTVSGGREINDINGAFNKCQDVLTNDEFIALCKLPVAGLENAFAKKLKEQGTCKTENAGKAEFAVIFDELITEKEPKKMLVEVKE